MSVMSRVVLTVSFVVLAALFLWHVNNRGELNITVSLSDDTPHPFLVTVFANTDAETRMVFEGLVMSNTPTQLRLEPRSPFSLSRLSVVVEHPGYQTIRVEEEINPYWWGSTLVPIQPMLLADMGNGKLPFSVVENHLERARYAYLVKLEEAQAKNEIKPYLPTLKMLVDRAEFRAEQMVMEIPQQQKFIRKKDLLANFMWLQSFTLDMEYPAFILDQMSPDTFIP